MSVNSYITGHIIASESTMQNLKGYDIVEAGHLFDDDAKQLKMVSQTFKEINRVELRLNFCNHFSRLGSDLPKYIDFILTRDPLAEIKVVHICLEGGFHVTIYMKERLAKTVSRHEFSMDRICTGIILYIDKDGFLNMMENKEIKQLLKNNISLDTALKRQPSIHVRVINNPENLRKEDTEKAFIQSLKPYNLEFD